MERLFVDREKDLQVLEQQYRMRDAAFVVMYGRRRLGKTTLIQRFIEGKPAVYFLAEKNTMRSNQDSFRDTAAAVFPDNPAFREDNILGWTALLEACCSNERERSVIVLDEFQNLVAVDEAFPSVLQRIWDCSLKQRNVMLILCGSVVSMMERDVLAYSSPLYGRRTAQIRLTQIPFRNTVEFYEGRNLSRRQLVEFFSVTGGVPRYIELFKDEPDLYDAIDRLVLDRRGYLYEEPMILLSKEAADAATYFGLVSAIARGNHRVSQIGSVLEIKPTSLSTPLKLLIDMDLVERAVPATVENPDTSKMGMYYLNDPFVTFWFRFVYPRRSFLEIDHIESASKSIRQSLVVNHTALVYENVCRETIWDLSATGQLPALYNQVGSWWGKRDVQIDVLAVDTVGMRDILFGECKFWKEPVGTDVLIRLIEKAKYVSWGGKDRREVYAIFSISGFTPALEALAEERSDVLLLQ